MKPSWSSKFYLGLRFEFDDEGKATQGAAANSE